MFSRSCLVIRQSCCIFTQKQSQRLLSPALVSSRCLSLTKCKLDDDAEKKVRRFTENPEQEGSKFYKVKRVDHLTSMQYMESDAYKTTYGHDPVWKHYRRNFKGHYQPAIRQTCVRAGITSSGSACPICRDDYLVFDYRNVSLMKQFISDATCAPLNPKQTGLCTKQYTRLHLEVMKAQDYGYLEKHVPTRNYDYDYYKKLVEEANAPPPTADDTTTTPPKPPKKYKRRKNKQKSTA